SLVALLRDDVVFAMPPWATWFRGVERLGAFFRSDRFTAVWSRGFRLLPVRANAQLAFVFYARDDAGYRRHSVQVVSFANGRVTEAIQFIGAEYVRGFDVPDRIP